MSRTKKERIKKSTKCPECKIELDDEDGLFFNEFSDTKKCPQCRLEIFYVKQLKRDKGNPFCKFSWNKTYIEWDESDLSYWKNEFIEYMVTKYSTEKDHAKQECEAYVESIGIDDLDDFETAVNECAEAWTE